MSSAGRPVRRRDWGFAGDYVRALWLMASHDEPDDYVIAIGETTVEEFVAAAFDEASVDWRECVRFDESFARGAADSPGFVGDPSRARERLGWGRRWVPGSRPPDGRRRSTCSGIRREPAVDPSCAWAQASQVNSAAAPGPARRGDPDRRAQSGPLRRSRPPTAGRSSGRRCRRPPGERPRRARRLDNLTPSPERRLAEPFVEAREDERERVGRAPRAARVAPGRGPRALRAVTGARVRCR